MASRRDAQAAGFQGDLQGTRFGFAIAHFSIHVSCRPVGHGQGLRPLIDGAHAASASARMDSCWCSSLTAAGWTGVRVKCKLGARGPVCVMAALCAETGDRPRSRIPDLSRLLTELKHRPWQMAEQSATGTSAEGNAANASISPAASIRGDVPRQPDDRKSSKRMYVHSSLSISGRPLQAGVKIPE